MIRQLRLAILKILLFILKPFSSRFSYTHEKTSPILHWKILRSNSFRKYFTILLLIGFVICIAIKLQRIRKSWSNIQQNKEMNHALIHGVNTCLDEKVYLLAVVHSAVGNKEKRQAIRETWGTVTSYKGLAIRHVFVLGTTAPENQTVLELVKSEADEHGDILQGDFVDSYHNLTRKVVFWIQWVDSYCADVEFIMKCDDDVLILPETTIDFIQDMKYYKNDSVLVGNFASNLQPHRENNSKWWITEGQWAFPYLPQFHQGYAQLMSKAVVATFKSAISERTVEEKFNATWTNFPVEDVYIGILANVTGVKLLGTRSFINVFYPEKGDFDLCYICHKVAILTTSIKQMKIAWCISRTMLGEPREPFKTYHKPIVGQNVKPKLIYEHFGIFKGILQHDFE